MSKHKRGQNEGTTRQRLDGRWEARFSVDGKQRSTYGKTKTEVLRKMRAALEQVDRGIPLANERLTVGSFLSEWLATSARTSVRPRTYAAYESHVRVHLVPAFGRIPLSKLTPEHVQRMMNQKLKDGLSPNTVLRIRATLRRALFQAVKWGRVSRNVATLVDPPKPERYQVDPISPEEANALLKAVGGHPLEACFTLALTVGMRQGEVLGLHWDDVDLDQGHLNVRYSLQRIEGRQQLVEPKSDRSRRKLPLPAVAVNSLRRHRAQQNRERLRAGDEWQDTGLVFTARTGSPLHGPNVLRSFRRLLKRKGLPSMRFHDLRHACASLLLAQDVSPRVVMETLGHSEIGLTMNTYSHVLPSLQREAADRMDELLGGAR